MDESCFFKIALQSFDRFVDMGFGQATRAAPGGSFRLQLIEYAGRLDERHFTARGIEGIPQRSIKGFQPDEMGRRQHTEGSRFDQKRHQ